MGSGMKTRGKKTDIVMIDISDYSKTESDVAWVFQIYPYVPLRLFC